MIYANTRDREHVAATPGACGTCPACAAPVIAKCGPLVAHHWAHARGEDCDTWSEPISAWHLGWQACAPPDRREIIIGAHRADLLTPAGQVVEIQHSHLSAAAVRQRETAYGRGMTWIFDAREPYETGRLDVRTRTRDGAEYATFRWKHPRRSLVACRARVLLDLGNGRLLRLAPHVPGHAVRRLGPPRGALGHRVLDRRLGAGKQEGVMTELSPWFCTACGQRVALAHARVHYDRCVGGDKDDECQLCDRAMRPTTSGLCDRCRQVAP